MFSHDLTVGLANVQDAVTQGGKSAARTLHTTHAPNLPSTSVYWLCQHNEDNRKIIYSPSVYCV